MNKKQIIKELRENLQIKEGDLLGVHSSLKSLGYLEGGAVSLIEALVEAVGGQHKGTILMPCFNEPCDTVDLRSTPCRLGKVAETFRQYPGVIRSRHQTHSVAVYGKEAYEIAAGHELCGPLGKGSPFHKLAIMGGFVLHIGCGMKSSSIIHIVESIAEIPYQVIPYTGYDKDIKLIIDEKNERNCTPFNVPGDSDSFMKVQLEMDKRGLLFKARLGEAECIKAKGSEIIAVALEMLKKDPFVLLSEGAAFPVSEKRRKYMIEKGY